VAATLRVAARVANWVATREGRDHWYHGGYP